MEIERTYPSRFEVGCFTSFEQLQVTSDDPTHAHTRCEVFVCHASR